MPQPAILVIEDDPHILELLKVCLEQEGYRVTAEPDGLVGLTRARRERFDLIVLDLMLPQMDGFTICRELSSGEGPRTPILILTAKGDEVDRVLGLKLGADDYVVKPFSPRELAARVEAILRRAEKGRAGYPEITAGELKIVPALREVTVNGEKVLLTPKEFDLLHLLALHPGRVFTREELLNRIWGYDYLGGSRTVDEHVKNLRQKIKDTRALYQYIHTVWGVGYKFEAVRS